MQPRTPQPWSLVECHGEIRDVLQHQTMLLTWPIRARFSTVWRQTICSTNHQVEKLEINALALLSCKAGGIAVEGSGSPSTLDNVDNLALAPDFPHCLEQTCETPNRLKDFAIKWQRLPSHTAECKTTQRLGSPSTSDDVENLARAPDSQHCLEWTSEVKCNY